MLCALQRKEEAGDLKAGGARALFAAFSSDVARGRLQLIPQSDAVLLEVQGFLEAKSADLPLRSLDALHLGSALSAGARVFVATDKRLREAAGRAGLTLVP